MRRGEVIGLRWRDVDFACGRIRIEQQLQRIQGELVTAPVKTDASRRTLPMITGVRRRLAALAPHGEETQDSDALVFTSSTGTPIDPKNFSRTFHEIREQAGLPRITVHHTRHTAATLLKNLGVPARDAQLILGHAHVTTTQQIYQHGDFDGQTRALERAGQLLDATAGPVIGPEDDFSTGQRAEIDALTPGGPGGL